MLVTITTLNSYGLEIAAGKSALIESLIDNNERDYLDAAMSVDLSELLTDATKTDERFTVLLDGFVHESKRVKGLIYGANHYIYALYLAKQYESISSSGQTVQAPENSKQLDPQLKYNALYNAASYAATQIANYIDDNPDTYPEYTGASGISEMTII